MGQIVAQKIVKLLASSGKLENARVGVLGLTFKENVPDLRNSRVPDILEELREYGIHALIHDPLADAAQAHREYGVTLAELADFQGLDALVLAVPHASYVETVLKQIQTLLRPGGTLIDIKSVYRPNQIPAGVHYWSL